MAAIRLTLGLLLFVALVALVVESSSLSGGDSYWVGGLVDSRACNGLVGDCIDDANELTMDSDISTRRSLRGRGRRPPPNARYISYAALLKNAPPCVRGRSYYGCRFVGKANPYRRECTMATHCARDLR
ncbi:rapid alkalinization factor-like [Telopea speciosissima]|uniref:rapid alkalinization factor-like n=1 Tax=Telopea speciosissima TaxID=54955 RepID=UPI001CC45FC2|nr:rapid alkalinization factor-like [Telopea speciosissima]